MRKAAMLVLMLVLALPVMADTLAVGMRVLTDGDSIGKVYELLGKPDRSVELQNKYGAAIGERLEYYRDGKTIQIVIKGGIVVSIHDGP